MRNRFSFPFRALIAAGVGGFSLLVLAHGAGSNWRAPEAAQKVKNPVAATATSVAQGKAIYDKVCFVCHGSKGDGKGPAGTALNPPPANFADPMMMGQMTDGELFWKLTTGRGKMAAYEKQYTAAERWAVVNYLRTFAVQPPPKPEQKVVYACPMHPEVTSDQPGKCPKCGMTLIWKELPPPALPKAKAAEPAAPAKPAPKTGEPHH